MLAEFPARHPKRIKFWVNLSSFVTFKRFISAFWIHKYFVSIGFLSSFPRLCRFQAFSYVSQAECDKAKTLILSINMILVICIPEAKQIGRQVLFISRIYSKWTFFSSFSSSLLFNVSYFIWCGYCYVKFVFSSLSLPQKGIPLFIIFRLLFTSQFNQIK